MQVDFGKRLDDAYLHLESLQQALQFYKDRRQHSEVKELLGKITQALDGIEEMQQSKP